MKAISLFSGAGGLDVGFKKAGFVILWANDFDKDAHGTYKTNIGDHIRQGDISILKQTELRELPSVNVVFGGPPCQGFSVAGKMDPLDPRSQHICTFADIVRQTQPEAFVMENVKALGQLKKWEPVRSRLLDAFRSAGYMTGYIVLNASEYNVPQSRERVFFIGFKGDSSLVPDLPQMLSKFKKKSPTVREALHPLDRAGTGNNKGLAKAKITIAPNPVMRKSPYAGMLFNGSGRPIRIDGYSSTLPATMGGNKTPIIDESSLYDGESNWVETYHKSLQSGVSPLASGMAPKRLRRLTVQEASALQTFPADYKFCGSQSSIFKQIGNAVPCNLGFAIASMIKRALLDKKVAVIPPVHS